MFIFRLDVENTPRISMFNEKEYIYIYTRPYTGSELHSKQPVDSIIACRKLYAESVL